MKKEPSLQEICMNFYNSRNEADFTKLYHRLRPSISYFLRELVPNYDDRNEVIATTFSKVWIKIDMYDPYWNFSTWVYRIARNEALLFHRASKRTCSYEALKERGSVDQRLERIVIIEIEEDPIDVLYQEAISAIDELPEVYKIVLTMREVQRKKYDEIANELGWNQNTVRTRIRKARDLVKVYLQEKNPALVKKYQER